MTQERTSGSPGPAAARLAQSPPETTTPRTALPPTTLPPTNLPSTAPPTTALPASGGTCCEDCSGATPAKPAEPDALWVLAARRARLLSLVSLVWMSLEGLVGLIAGIDEGSIALLGWALGSVIEGLASVIVIWRFTGSRTLSTTSEARAHRAVAISFFLLAPYITIEAVHDLFDRHVSCPGLAGVLITASSVAVMPALGVVKRRLGTRLASGATAGEGTQNLMCAAQAAAVLVGLAVTATLGWTWLDPAVALLLAGWAVREGVVAWRGEDCC